MTGEGLAEVISAASLVLAGLAALYTLWLPEVAEARKITPEGDPNNRAPQKLVAGRALWSKAFPLVLASGFIVAILLPRGLMILCEVGAHGHEWAYDDIKAMFMLMLALFSFLAGAAIIQFFDLLKVKRSLDR